MSKTKEVIGQFLTPLSSLQEDYLSRLLRELGIPHLNNVKEAYRDLAQAMLAVVEGVASEEAEQINFYQSLLSIENAIDAIDSFKRTLESNNPSLLPSILNEVAGDLGQYLLHRYLANYRPLFYNFLSFLDVITPKVNVDFNGERTTYSLPQIDFEKLKSLLADPKGHILDPILNLPPVDAKTLLYYKIVLITNALGGYTKFTYGADLTEIESLTTLWRFKPDEGQVEIGFKLQVDTLNGVRINGSLTPIVNGAANIDLELGGYQLTVSSSLNGSSPALAIQDGKLQSQGSAMANLQFAAHLIPLLEENQPYLLLGNPAASHISLRTFDLSVEARLEEGQAIGANVGIDLQDIEIVIKVNEQDGFIQQLFPPEGFRIPLSLLIGYDTAKGLYFGLDAGLEWTKELHLTLFNTIKIQQLKVGLGSFDELIRLSSQLSFSLALGPFNASVKEMGIGLDLDPDHRPANIGIGQLNGSIIPPSGLGLSVDTGLVKGGGFIDFYPDKGEYNGIFELTVGDFISVKVLALLTTRMPNGDNGFSLLLIVMAEFTPIQLGFGFTLLGVGGLVGVNRTMVLDALREGVRTGATDNILFPENPVANAPQIISDLQTVFPVEEGRYAFGLMGKIGYGTPTIISLELGLIMEVPNPIRLAILGVLKAVLPEETAPILKLQVNFVGTIDFEQEFITFDASLFDSKLLTWTLSGDMAVRIKGGDNPNFVFTVGGFHPDYTPPPLGLPALRRLSISLLTGKNPRLTISSYFAITSNTAQFGAKVDFYYKVSGKIYVKGWMGFDALFQFSPFYFRTDFSAGLGVYYRKKSYLSINLTVFLEGPTPWHANGTARFKVLCFKYKVKFDKTWGKKEHKTLPPKRVYPALRAALEHPSNWQPIALPQSQTGVTMREIEDADQKLLLRPDATVGVRQKVVPLNVRIDKFGEHTPADYDHFELELLDEDDNVISGEALREQFAPNHFFRINKDSLLSRPNFEKYEGGLQINVDSNTLHTSTFSEREVIYEELIMDEENGRRRTVGALRPAKILPAYFNTYVNGGSASRSAFAKGSNASQQFVADKVEVSTEGYRIVNALTGETHSDSVGFSRAEAQRLLEDSTAGRPDLQEELIIVPENEMAF